MPKFTVTVLYRDSPDPENLPRGCANDTLRVAWTGEVEATNQLWACEEAFHHCQNIDAPWSSSVERSMQMHDLVIVEDAAATDPWRRALGVYECKMMGFVPMSLTPFLF